MMRFSTRLGPVLALVLAAAACTPYQEPAPTVRLPNDAVQGAGDPLNASLTLASSVFSSPRRLAGQPAVAARAVASMEFVAVDLPENARVSGGVAALLPQLPAARTEWRAALGIAQDAPPQAVINGLFAAARALDYGQQSAALEALSAPIFTRGGAQTLAILNDMPSLPRTNAAAVDLAGQLQRRGGIAGGRT